MKPIPGFPDYYCCDEGHVWSEKRGPIRRLKPYIGTYPYYALKLVNEDGVPISITQHRVVTITHKGPPPDDGRQYDVHHRNGDKLDNRPENLEWIEADEHRRLSAQESSKAGWKRMTPHEVREVRRLYHEEGMSKRAISRKFNRNFNAINCILNGKTRKDVT